MTTLAPSPQHVDTPLSTLLREATHAEHRHAESRSFVTSLMAGELDVAAYVDLAVQHRAIYTALEAGAAQVAAEPGGELLALPALARRASLEADLVALAGPDWAGRARVLPSTRRYVGRLARVAGTLPGYLPHAYTRYLGDLSGGQVVRTMLQRHYGLAPEQLSFYHFAGIGKPKVFKDAYRAAIDAVVLAEVTQQEVLAEAKLAFALNAAVFGELGERHLPTDPRPAA